MALCGVCRALRLEYCIEYVLVHRVVCTDREERRYDRIWRGVEDHERFKVLYKPLCAITGTRLDCPGYRA